MLSDCLLSVFRASRLPGISIRLGVVFVRFYILMGAGVLLAVLRDAAFRAFGMTCSTDVSAMQYQPMMGYRDELGGNMLDQSTFGAERCLGAASQPEAVGNPKYVSIDRHRRFVKHDG